MRILPAINVVTAKPCCLCCLSWDTQVDYKSLVKAVEAMGPEEFSKLDLDKLLAQYSS